MSDDRTAHETDEIEITPEMVCAGARELIGFNLDYESEYSAVRRIYLAMTEALYEFHLKPKLGKRKHK